MKSLFLFVISLLCLTIVSCDSKETKEELPALKTECEFTRSYYYPATNETKIRTHSSNEMKLALAEYFRFADIPFLNLSFEPQEVEAEDIHFSILTSRLTANFISEYTLVPYSGGLDNMNGDAKVQYGYGSAMNYYFHSGDAAGNVKITDYDSRHKMLSGTFSFEILSNSDPLKPYPNENECTISISGRFKNVPIKE